VPSEFLGKGLQILLYINYVDDVNEMFILCS
jgi:hypothetical protein